MMGGARGAGSVRGRAGGAACLLLSVGLLGGAASVPRLTMAGTGETPIEAYVREQVAASALPGVAVAVVDGGRVTDLVVAGAGPDGTPMTGDTRLVIGSVGKSITALAVRQLEVAGAIDLTAPVGRYLPWFALDAAPSFVDGITIRSLLEHTSGLSTADGQDPRWYEPSLTPERVVRGLASVRPDRPPGTYEYSNLNFVVLGMVVEAASGQSYDEYLRSRVFEPLGMTRSGIGADAAGSPTGWRYLLGLTVPATEPYPAGIVAAGYQVSTANDMARYLIALAGGGVSGSLDLVSGRPASGPGPALGTDWQPAVAVGGGSTTSQSGSTLTTNADILVEPGTGRGVVVLIAANPTQFLGLPAGAADIALDVLRLHAGGVALTAAPTVRSVYLVVDAMLVVLILLLAIHVARARDWPTRWRSHRRRSWLAVRTAIADGVLPVIVVLGLPLLIGTTGSTRPGDVVGGWQFVLWTLPDLGWPMLAMAILALLLGVLKAAVVAGGRGRPRGEPAGAD
jgi:CubicO group peptidase (beta-lactamase class C family)